MSAPLKDMYSPLFFERFSKVLAKVLPGFDKKQFTEQIFTDAFQEMELKERVKHTTSVLHDFLPGKYAAAVKVIGQLIDVMRKDGFGEHNFVFMFLPDFVETYGLDHYKDSVKAIEMITQFISCEYAVRPFILKYGEPMIAQMTAWSLHPDKHVRRLASEGCRPRLPWAMALPALKKDPSPILPLLENLKNDPEEYVRRSVANNLNDIAKDHPAVVLRIAARWKGISKATDAIIKHGSRTLLKQGHTDILKFYGLDSRKLDISAFTIITPEVNTGAHLEFAFDISNSHKQEQVVRLEYAVYYRKQNGELSRKVFKISEKIYRPGEKISVVRRQSFKPITTKKFYPGEHQLGIVINGAEKARGSFVLNG